MDVPAPSEAASVDEVVAAVDNVRRTPGLRDTLVDLLREQSAIYEGLSTNEAERLRGYILASFEATGLPPSALPYVCEELETGLNPYTVAAAAKAVRGADAIPEQVVPLLVHAVDRIKLDDDRVWFDSYVPVPGCRPPTTALMELFRTLAWLGPRAGAARGALEEMIACPSAGFSAAVRVEIERAIGAISGFEAPRAGSCCAGPANSARTASDAAARHELSLVHDVEGVELQDQDGTVLTYREFFRGRPSVLAFFYTRCMNPDKCPLTITKLARVQCRISELQLGNRFNVAALTYDPSYDLPHRLRDYGVFYGMRFDDRNRLLRTTGSFEPLRRRFDLGVGYGPATVNRHRVELFVLDAQGREASALTRRLWHEDQVVEALTTAALS